MQLLGLSDEFWIGVGITLILTTLVYYLQKKECAPWFAVTSTKWFDTKNFPHKDLELRFKDKPVERFVISYVAFWNAGKKVLTLGDVAPSRQLSLVVEGQSFDVRLLSASDRAINAYLDKPTIKEGVTIFPIKFEYLEKNDGFYLDANQFSPEETAEVLAKRLAIIKARRNSM